jgi:multiple sugar transport system permease protein
VTLSAQRFWVGLRYGFLALGGFLMLVPFLEMILGSLKTQAEMIAIPMVWIPKTPQWKHYADVVKMIPMAKLYKNSLIVSSSVTVLVLLTSSLTGFALAKYQFKGRDAFFKFLLSTLMFPQFIFLIPVYFLLKNVPLAGGNDLFGAGGSGLLKTYWALILPFACSGFGIFLMRQFMLTIPDDLLQAARIDGAGEFRIFWQIVLPNLGPALATLAIFTFIGTWNEFIWAMVITTSARDLMTLPVGIQLLRGNLDPLRVAGLMRAALTIAVIPMLLFFITLQRYYIRGITMTGLKG